MRVYTKWFIGSDFNIAASYVILICLSTGITYEAFAQNTDSVDLQNFTLHKCICGPNHIYENGNCSPMNTEVEFVIKFWPSIEKEIVSTGDVPTVITEELACPPTTQSLKLNRVSFTKEKTLFHMESGERFSENYCIEHVNNSGEVEIEANVCLPNFKVPTCCEPGLVLNSTAYKCTKTLSNAFQPPIFLGSVFINVTDNLQTYKGRFPSCNGNKLKRKVLDNSTNSRLQYQKAEIIFFEMEENSMPSLRFPSEYCLAVEEDIEGKEFYAVITWDENEIKECVNIHKTNASDKTAENGEEETCDNIMNLVVILLLSFSTLFLLLILGFHAIMPDLRKSLGSKITVCHVTSLFCGFCLLLFLHVPHSLNCKVYGPMIQICFLATFFWLNVMCFDIWWKLWCRSPAGETAQSANTQFLYYSIYAWGSPLIIGAITIAMDNLPQLTENTWVIVPGFGKYNCWFAEKNAALAYYFGIIGVLMAFNAFFFVWVFGIVFSANCAYKKILKNNPNASSRAWIYWKIFGVMGITWIFEYLSWMEGTCKYWIFTDIINSLRGVILFLIFFGNRKSLRKMKEKFASINEVIQDQVNKSVNNLRKFSLKPSGSAGTIETGMDSPNSLGLQNSEGNNNSNNNKNIDVICMNTK